MNTCHDYCIKLAAKFLSNRIAQLSKTKYNIKIRTSTIDPQLCQVNRFWPKGKSSFK